MFGETANGRVRVTWTHSVVPAFENRFFQHGRGAIAYSPLAYFLGVIGLEQFCSGMTFVHRWLSGLAEAISWDRKYTFNFAVSFNIAIQIIVNRGKI